MGKETGSKAADLTAMVNKFLNDMPYWLKREMFIRAHLDHGFKMEDILAVLDGEPKEPEPTPAASPASTRTD